MCGSVSTVKNDALFVCVSVPLVLLYYCRYSSRINTYVYVCTVHTTEIAVFLNSHGVINLTVFPLHLPLVPQLLFAVTVKKYSVPGISCRIVHGLVHIILSVQFGDDVGQ